MLRRHLPARLAALVILTMSPWSAALAEAPRVVGSQPAANAVLDGRPADYLIRFAGPVDHQRSSLAILRDGQVVERMNPRLDAAPDVLFARGLALAPGAYELRWTMRSLQDGSVTEGSVPFSVRR
jgi:methionine-rich copper-binding protein CopC